MDTLIQLIIPLILGYLLDFFAGDPRWLPHPIRWFGYMISKADKLLNRGKNKRLKGALAVIFLSTFVFIICYASIYLYAYSKIAYVILSSIIVFFGLANRSLIQESNAVVKELQENGLEAGRNRLAWIVGRDVKQLSPNQIKIAVLETLSENLSDGVVAPIFYYAIAGVPGIMTYKMINTLDSMIGYKSEKYKDFGYAAAKIDDLVNFLPARLTAYFIAVVNFSKRSFIFIGKYGRAHSSPNAGFPEAALAGVLDCQFGGPNYYKGKLVDKPYIGAQARVITKNDLRIAMVTNQLVCLLSVALSVLVFYLIFRFY